MENNDNTLSIYQKYLNLIYYTNDIVRKFPKSEKFALVEEIKLSLYSGLRSLMFAIKLYSKKEKLQNLNELDVNLNLLKVQVRIAYKYRYISMRNYESWCELITIICNMLGSLINSFLKK